MKWSGMGFRREVRKSGILNVFTRNFHAKNDSQPNSVSENALVKEVIYYHEIHELSCKFTEVRTEYKLLMFEDSFHNSMLFLASVFLLDNRESYLKLSVVKSFKKNSYTYIFIQDEIFRQVTFSYNGIELKAA